MLNTLFYFAMSMVVHFLLVDKVAKQGFLCNVFLSWIYMCAPNKALFTPEIKWKRFRLETDMKSTFPSEIQRYPQNFGKESALHDRSKFTNIVL